VQLRYLPLLWPVIRSGGPPSFDLGMLHNANRPPVRRTAKKKADINAARNVQYC